MSCKFVYIVAKKRYNQHYNHKHYKMYDSIIKKVYQQGNLIQYQNES